MRVVALISGGKDSCYNMVQCVAAGHDVVALANLRPESQGNLSLIYKLQLFFIYLIFACYLTDIVLLMYKVISCDTFYINFRN